MTKVFITPGVAVSGTHCSNWTTQVTHVRSRAYIPRSSSCDSVCDVKPKAACQSVELDTGIVSGISGVCGGGTELSSVVTPRKHSH